MARRSRALGQSRLSRMSNYNPMNGFHGSFDICMHSNLGHLLPFSLLDLMPNSPGKHPFFNPNFDNIFVY